MAIFVLTTPSQPTLPSSYTLAAVAPSCATPKNHICYIVATDDGTGHPCFLGCNDDLLDQILTALNTNTDSLNVKLKP